MNLDLTAINAVQERLLAGSFDMPRSPAMADQARFELALGEMPGASAPNGRSPWRRSRSTSRWAVAFLDSCAAAWPMWQENGGRCRRAWPR